MTLTLFQMSAQTLVILVIMNQRNAIVNANVGNHSKHQAVYENTSDNRVQLKTILL